MSLLGAPLPMRHCEDNLGDHVWLPIFGGSLARGVGWSSPLVIKEWVWGICRSILHHHTILVAVMGVLEAAELDTHFFNQQGAGKRAQAPSRGAGGAVWADLSLEMARARSSHPP